MLKNLVLIITITSSLFSCATQKSSTNLTSDEPAIASLLPTQIENYKYSGYQLYSAGLGYSLRYNYKNFKYHFADIYIWPTPEQAKKYSHKELIYAVTNAGIRDIYTIQDKGRYSNVKILDKGIYKSKNNILTMHKISMLRDNINSLSFLYVTEFNGKLLKARISMPDNPKNRKRKDTVKFVREIFNQIIKNIKHA